MARIVGKASVTVIRNLVTLRALLLALSFIGSLFSWVLIIDLTKVSSHDSVFVYLRVQNRFPRKIRRLFFFCYKDIVVFILPVWNFTRTSHQAKNRGNICIYYMFLYTTFTFPKKRGCEKQTVQLKIQNSSCTKKRFFV